MYLVPYNGFSKKLIRNYDKIRTCMMYDLLKKHEVEYTNFEYMDFLVDNEKYLKIMLFLDINQICYISSFLNANPQYKSQMYFVCFEENEKYLREWINDCNTIIIDKSTIDDYLANDFIEVNGMKMDFPSE